MSASAEIRPKPTLRRAAGLCAAPVPMPMTNRPPVISLTVPPVMAKDTGVLYMTGDTPIPVPTPSATASRLAIHRWTQR